ncbi:Calcium/calmodulin-dependent protein kinase type 1B [Lasiodiplodia theobromae]|uniref:Calcium/calmodulin-dependent protein kinase type 1B n=1 Tax=Lasiodiplodia theobromae TaxID=45133 RepID=A0A5N5CZ15_9PEZI|nr:Calcium/calmodulin-dependent protein kinase type 1B [Lasiodiplodia theobromae]
MSTIQPPEIDYRVIDNSEDVPFEKDPRESTSFGGAVEGVRPTKRFESSFHGEGKYVQKTLKLDLSETEEESNARVKRLFHQEVKNLHHARHQHVIDITMAYFFQHEEEPYFAIIMPRADGNLKRFMERMTQTSSDSTKKKLVSKWFGCLANVTEFIHGIGIRHRDVKPENILYKGGRIMFADFGISKMGLGKTLSTTVPQWMRTATPKSAKPEEENLWGRTAIIF